MNPNYIKSLTPNAAQRIIFFDDKPNEYPCTPQEFTGDPLTAYAYNLTEGAIFFRNYNGPYVVVKSGFSKDRQAIYVITKAGYTYEEQENGEQVPVLITDYSEDICQNLPYAINEVIYENGLFVHGRPATGFLPKEYIEKMFTEYTQDR